MPRVRPTRTRSLAAACLATGVKRQGPTVPTPCLAWTSPSQVASPPSSRDASRPPTARPPRLRAAYLGKERIVEDYGACPLHVLVARRGRPSCAQARLVLCG